MSLQRQTCRLRIEALERREIPTAFCANPQILIGLSTPTVAQLYVPAVQSARESAVAQPCLPAVQSATEAFQTGGSGSYAPHSFQWGIG
jgi:hypothetical protein